MRSKEKKGWIGRFGEIRKEQYPCNASGEIPHTKELFDHITMMELIQAVQLMLLQLLMRLGNVVWKHVIGVNIGGSASAQMMHLDFAIDECSFMQGWSSGLLLHDFGCIWNRPEIVVVSLRCIDDLLLAVRFLCEDCLACIASRTYSKGEFV